MQPSRVQLRIVAGNLRGRKITAVVHEDLRPTPQMVREALFSILGNAVPGRPFFDLFAGTGVHGLEAISRGGSEAVFVEHDARLATAIEARLKEFDVLRQGHVVRSDVYRWAERWIPPVGPVNLFLSPPFA
ncbi:MAG TPA: RsmD family RNA methyltransferase, partial [Gemmataceae bacterium]|nr:RsmD family RNA methyltransferase [Gemmataceae bacterium]